MRRRGFLVLLVVLVLVQALSFSVFAANDDEPEFLGAMLDTIGGFFRGLGEDLIDGLKYLFIPRDDYLQRAANRIQSAFMQKFGGLVGLMTHLRDCFSNLRAYRGNLLVIEYPQGHLFGGARIDLLAGADGIAALVRGGLSAFVVLSTAAYVIHQVQGMIRE